jgi:hypothetical protein
MKSTKHPLSVALLATLAIGSLSACSSAIDSGGGADGEVEEIAQLEVALSSDLACGYADANKSFNSIIAPTYTSSSGYAAGRNGCGRAYFVRVNDYRQANQNKVNVFEYAGSSPVIGDNQSSADCAARRLMVYVFERKSDGTVKYIDNKSVYGNPQFFQGAYMACNLPRIAVDGSWLNLTTGRNYQFAVSARINDLEGGDPVMQPIRMGSVND